MEKKGCWSDLSHSSILGSRFTIHELMRDLIGLAFTLLAVFGGLYLLTRPQKPLTVEEYEKRLAEGTGLAGAGMIGLQKVLDPGAAKAAIVVEDLRQGYLDGEQESGDKDDTSKDVNRES
jgi:hypothetical protein